MNGRDDGFRRTLDGVDGIVQTRRQRRLAKFSDVGTRHEGAAFTRKNADLDLWILREFGDAIDNRGAHADTDGIDRRIVDPDDPHVAALFESALHGLLQMKAEAYQACAMRAESRNTWEASSPDAAARAA